MGEQQLTPRNDTPTSSQPDRLPHLAGDQRHRELGQDAPQHRAVQPKPCGLGIELVRGRLRPPALRSLPAPKRHTLPAVGAAVIRLTPSRRDAALWRGVTGWWCRFPEEAAAAIEIRSTTDQDLDVLVDTIHAAFGHLPEAPAGRGGGQWWSAFEMDRGLLAVTPEGRAVGTAVAYSFELTLPGEILVPAAGVSGMSVLPTHRRQGVLTAMMRHQLTELRARGEFLSVLLATEAPIYGRFGYGPATYTGRLTVPRHQAALDVPPSARNRRPQWPARAHCLHWF